MKKAFLPLLIAVLAVVKLTAQDQAIYSQYQIFPVLVNPALAGFNEKHEVLMNVRSQWAGYPGAPKSYTLMYNGPFGDKLALGAGVFNENIGSYTRQRIALNYAFRYAFGPTKVGIGMSTEFHRIGLASSILTSALYDKGDELVEQYVDGVKIFDATAGIWANFNQQLFVGLSLPSIVRQNLNAVPSNSPNSRGGKSYIFQLGYVADVKSLNARLIPSLALRKIFDVPYQVDLNLRGEFIDRKLITGITLRPSTGGSAAFLLGTKLKQMQFHYSYDVSFQRFQQFNGGSHELSLMFDFDRKQKRFDASSRFK